VQLELQSEFVGNVCVIRCRGRIVTGEEVRALQQEIEKYTLETKKFVLQLAEVKYVDSGGLGAMVRLAGVLRASRGDLKLCEISPFVAQVLEATLLNKVFRTLASEKEAVDAFSVATGSQGAITLGAGEKIACIDTSADLLAYLNALLKRSGYEVFTTHSLSDAKTYLRAMRPNVVVCGPGLQANEFAMESVRQSAPHSRFLLLPSDFSTAHASEAGLGLVERLRALAQNPQ
jgi:anti-anti-sigma factor